MYVGQAVYPLTAPPRLGVVIAIEQEPIDDTDRLLAAERHDRVGRLWLVNEIYPVAATPPGEDESPMVAPGDHAAPAFEGSAIPLLSDPFVALETTWSHSDCVSDPYDLSDHGAFDGDSRIEVDFAFRAQRAVVLIRTSAGLCSGTLLDSDYVLTAAHCLVDDSYDDVAVGSIDVCSYGNLFEQ